MKQCFSVRPIIRKDKVKADGTCPIYYQVIINSIPTKLPSGSSTMLSNWDYKNNLEKGSKTSYLNCKLKQQSAALEKFLLTEIAKGNPLTIEGVKAFYNKKDSEDFFQYYDEFCKHKFLKVSKGTKYQYELVRERLLEFKPKLRLSDITISFVERFDYFLRIDKGIGDGGRANHHKKLRAVLKRAFNEKILDIYPYQYFEFDEGDAKNDSLSENQAKALETLTFEDVENGAGLEIARDMFLFACFTGLRCSDVIDFKKSCIVQDLYISLVMKKTKGLVNIPLFEKTKKIIAKYSSEDSDFLFPKRSNQSLNRNLKVIAEMCQIDLNVTFHLARHTFGTMLAKSGVNMFDIMRLLGHQSLDQTQIYVTSDLNAIQNQLSNIKFFN